MSRIGHETPDTARPAGDKGPSAPPIIVHGVDLMPVADLSEATLRAHGANAVGAGWRDATSQVMRFAKLVQSVGLDVDQPVSVNDLGSGYGGLYAFLAEEGFQVETYRGHDICAAMVQAGRDAVGGPVAEFVQAGRIVAAADYAFASGIFNIQVGSVEEWKRYARAVLLDMARSSTQGFAFNMLTTHHTYTEDRFFYGDPAEWLEWCMREISLDVQLLHDYAAYEWTIGVRTDGRSPTRGG